MPISAAIPTAINPTISDMRVPKTMRLNRSLPRLSVPKTCSFEGPVRMFSISIFPGSCVATNGAKIAIIAKNNTILNPNIINLFILYPGIDCCI